MKGELKGIYADTFDPATYLPDDASLFCESIRIVIGLEGSRGGDNFFVDVCTARWLELNCRSVMWGRHLLIVSKYDLDEIRDFISHYINECEGRDWNEIAGKLARPLAWEFEDYVPSGVL